MTVSRASSRASTRSDSQRTFQPQVATLVTLAILGFLVALFTAWAGGDWQIQRLFEHLHYFQENPPVSLSVPTTSERYLLAVTGLLLLGVLAVMRVSPQPRQWSRVIVVSILLGLLIRYVLWRSLSSLNLADPLNGFFSLTLFLLEIPILFSTATQLFFMLREKDRRREADQVSAMVLAGQYVPSVDILIPTYNEPTFILRRTIVGCQALEYTNKTIYLLDDTRRPEMRQLARELGCKYVTRPNNLHAKAGNINHAIAKTSGELVVVFDADFVPTKNFLTRTVGFFQDPTVGLVQTYKGFYNFDPIARNLGLEKALTYEEEVCSRHYQLLRDGSASTMCVGTSFVARRAALEATGGFVTESLCEDFFTGISVSAKGYQVIYLSEQLSAGLAAESVTDHIAQRMRWARGTFQAFFIKANPLTIPGLRLRQRLINLEGILQWFSHIQRLGFLLIPLLSFTSLTVLPVKATIGEFLYFFLPYYLVHSAVFSWLNHRSRSAILSDVYAVSQCIPISITLIQTLLNPFTRGFKVTPKGTYSDRYSFNWVLGGPLLLLLTLTLISLWKGLEVFIQLTTGQIDITSDQLQGLGLMLIWNTYNAAVLGIAVLSYLDVPRTEPSEWFNVRRTTCLTINDRSYWGTTTMMSENGAEISLHQLKPINASGAQSQSVQLALMEENLCLSGRIISSELHGDSTLVRLQFESLSFEQYRQLIELLFCRPGQWRGIESPNELQMLLLLCKCLLRPRCLAHNSTSSHPIAVANV
jgi:cellulose synthase (UDP-forming)